MIGRYCMVRTKNAGVFAGTVAALNGQTATLTDARRIWYWDGAATLSQLSTEGTKKPKNCKFSIAVAEVILFEVIEIILVSNAAKESIEGVPAWKA